MLSFFDFLLTLYYNIIDAKWQISRKGENFMKMKGIVYKSGNMILQHVNRTESRFAVIVGPGHTIALDEADNITFKDPLFTPPKQNKHYGGCNVFMYYYTLHGRGLEAAGEELARFINENMRDYQKVILHGHSKSGLDFLSIAGREILKRKVAVVAVSAPLRGTQVADWESFREILDTKIEKYAYSKIFSNHSVDQDICFGSQFIKMLQIEKAFEQHNCNVIVSRCGKLMNPIDWILGWLDTRWKIGGDGVVPLYCQVPGNGIPYNEITASHATSLQRSVYYVMRLI